MCHGRPFVCRPFSASTMRWLKRRVVPQFQRINGLNIIVTIKQNMRRTLQDLHDEPRPSDVLPSGHSFASNPMLCQIIHQPLSCFFAFGCVGWDRSRYFQCATAQKGAPLNVQDWHQYCLGQLQFQTWLNSDIRSRYLDPEQPACHAIFQRFCLTGSLPFEAAGLGKATIRIRFWKRNKFSASALSALGVMPTIPSIVKKGYWVGYYTIQDFCGSQK